MTHPSTHSDLFSNVKFSRKLYPIQNYKGVQIPFELFYFFSCHLTLSNVIYRHIYIYRIHLFYIYYAFYLSFLTLKCKVS